MESKHFEFDASSDEHASFLFRKLDELTDKTAALFVEDWGVPYDSEVTDWESEAFAVDWSALKREFGDGIEELRDEAFERYMERLEYSTQQLCEASRNG